MEGCALRNGVPAAGWIVRCTGGGVLRKPPRPEFSGGQVGRSSFRAEEELLDVRETLRRLGA